MQIFKSINGPLKMDYLFFFTHCIAIHYSSLFKFLLFQSMGGWALLSLNSYASDSGATRICQWEAKVKERSDQAGGGYGRGVSPSDGREIFLKVCI